MSDGKILTTQIKQYIGTDVRNLKDATGKLFGPELYAAVKEGQVTQVSDYMFPKPSAWPCGPLREVDMLWSR